MARANSTLVYREVSRWLRSRYSFLGQHGTSSQANSMRLWFKKNQPSTSQRPCSADDRVKIGHKTNGSCRSHLQCGVCARFQRISFLWPWPHIFIIYRSCLPNVVNRRMNIMSRFWMIASLKVSFSSLLHRAVWTSKRSPLRTLVPSSPLPSTLRKGSASPKRSRLPRSSASVTLTLKTRHQTSLSSFIISSRPRTPRR